MNDSYLSVTQVAALKRVSRSAVYKAVQEGRLLATEIVGKVAIKQADAQAWQARTPGRRTQGKPVSAEARAKISASQRLRWQKRREG